MVKVIGPRDKKTENEYVINCTSRSPTWSSGLSPFYLGPVKLYDSYTSVNVENAWQYSKVYAEHVGADGKPTSNYFAWAKAGWEKLFADRYPMGKGSKPEFSYWDGERLTYVQARRRIYIPIYADAVRSTEAYSKLSSLYKTFGSLTLWDFDAYDHRALGRTWDDVIDDPNRKCGHGFVLAMMLEGFLK